MIRAIAIAVTFAFAVAPALAAGPLTEDEVQRFVKTLAPVHEMGARLEKNGTLERFADREPLIGKEFSPYSTAVANLKAKAPAEHQVLAGIIRPHGFSTDEWGAVGDRVMTAYMALRMEEENPNAMKQMNGVDPSMLAQMPPAMRSQMERVMAMMETVGKTPAADKAAVKPMMKAIEAEIDKPAE